MYLGREDRRPGQGQLPGPAALWVIFGPSLHHFSEDNASPRDHWAAGPDERKERINGNPPVVY